VPSRTTLCGPCDRIVGVVRPVRPEPAVKFRAFDGDVPPLRTVTVRGVEYDVVWPRDPVT
jgi:hypothetical protein